MGIFVKVETPDRAAISSRGAGGDSSWGILPAGDVNSAWKYALMALPFGFLWLRLLDNLRLEWATDPQYGYGWAVPLLCLGLIFRRQQRGDSSSSDVQGVADSTLESKPKPAAAIVFAILAFLYLPTRLVEGATPEWRPIQWLLGFEAIGLTLCAIYWGKGPRVLGQLAFPICFFLVAIPWPTLIETPIIQGLSRFNAAIAVELLGWLGVPAIQHGNVIEISTGMVGIDDACSGIRSFQSSLMISLFWGEYYRLRRPRRWLLIFTSFILAIVFNVCRTSSLTYGAAMKGTAAILAYHDDAGLAILLACFATTWLVAALLKWKNNEAAIQHPPGLPGAARELESGGSRLNETSGRSGRARPGPALFKRFSFALLLWLAVVEISVQLWYNVRESQLKPGPAWSVSFPEDNPSFKVLPIPEKTRYLLRFDEGKQGQWSEPDGTMWQAFYFNWLPGRVAGYLAKRHEPEICLPAAGVTLRTGPELTMLNVHGVALPMRSYVFETPDGPLNVYQCRWEAGASPEAYVAEDSSRYNLVRAVWAGRGKQGQKVLEIVVNGAASPEEAKADLVRELDKLVKVDNSRAAAQAQAGIILEPRS
jgi:exosortase